MSTRRRSESNRWARWTVAVGYVSGGILLLPLIVAAPAMAQHASLDTASLAAGPEMRTLLEKTIFKVDVLTLQVRFGGESALRLERLGRGREYDDALADSIAQIAIHSRDAWARIEFQRDVSLGQFLDGVRENMREARQAGIITDSDYETISDGLSRWFAFLEERGIRDGDRIVYRITGDTLRTLYRARDGAILLDQTDIGAERRLAVLGSYFSRGSDFREGLIRSLLEATG